MTDYAAFLRGMNVGGHRIKNGELRSLFEALGFSEVGTFRASGNVLFSAPRKPLAELTAKIEEGLRASLGYGVPTYLRTAGEVRAIAEHQPFPAAQIAASAGKLQVALLTKRPTADARKEVLAMAGDQDKLTLTERELYWLPSGGILDSALDLEAIAKLLGPTTTRTKGTIEQIAAKHFAD
jgi:uncharacterized protein (DUF1697 family)